ncbi:hypothetical protein HRR84_008474 [Exophiala dermatitidis]|nr:hypothetical protein HRR84_008474 [Exophiala dermatitidis]KAJ4629717.1 hypothetical protein HRR89_008884 [Exophiala dermatitidis]KAJ4638791.1 hypothetical protein HRR91_008896 [Exophiala dermatitidis]KAJ4691965.1 hypothetical protein HRR87_006918 [Exophiala dermatitidis]
MTVTFVSSYFLFDIPTRRLIVLGTQTRTLRRPNLGAAVISDGSHEVNDFHVLSIAVHPIQLAYRPNRHLTGAPRKRHQVSWRAGKPRSQLESVRESPQSRNSLRCRGSVAARPAHVDNL